MEDNQEKKIDVRIPELDEKVEKVTISFWYINEGEHTEEGDNLIEVSSGKKVFNISSPATGIVSEMFFDEGEVVEIGEAIAVIEPDDMELDLEEE